MTCTACEYPTPDGLHLCRHCHQHLCTLLGRVPDTIQTAEVTLANMGVTPRVGSAGTSAPTAPINLDMSTRLSEYRKRILDLALWIDEQENHGNRIFTSTTQAAGYIRHMANTIRQRDWAGDLYTELRNLERRVLSCADRPVVKRPLGECGALTMDDDGLIFRCTGTIMGHETATTGRCNTCHREHDVTDKIAQRISEAWHIVAPLAVIVRALTEAGWPVKYATARKWVERGKLHPRCDINTRQEGHTVAEVYTVLQSAATGTR